MPSRPPASSRQNPRFKATLALRKAGERRAQQRFLVDGTREIGHALDAGLTPLEAWVAPETIDSQATRALLPRLHGAGAEVTETTAGLLASLAYGDRDDGLVVVMRQPPSELRRLALPERALVAVMVRLEKPGNLGALLRSADGAGVDAVIVADGVSDLWNPNAIRASLGTIFRVSLAACSSEEAIAFLRARQVGIVTARVDAALEYDRADLSGRVAIVVGSEDAGLGAAWSGDGMTSIRIPMLGAADSLNVSASAAVLFYEARRQRRAAAQHEG